MLCVELPLVSDDGFVASGRRDWRWFRADWRDDLKFKARPGTVVRSLTEYHDRCCGRSRRSCYEGGQFLSFSLGIVPIRWSVSHMRIRFVAINLPVSRSAAIFGHFALLAPRPRRGELRHYDFYKSPRIIHPAGPPLLPVVPSRTSTFLDFQRDSLPSIPSWSFSANLAVIIYWDGSIRIVVFAGIYLRIPLEVHSRLQGFSERRRIGLVVRRLQDCRIGRDVCELRVVV